MFSSWQLIWLHPLPPLPSVTGIKGGVGYSLYLPIIIVIIGAANRKIFKKEK
jgi:hypothetical protein